MTRLFFFHNIFQIVHLMLQITFSLKWHGPKKSIVILGPAVQNIIILNKAVSWGFIESYSTYKLNRSNIFCWNFGRNFCYLFPFFGNKMASVFAYNMFENLISRSLMTSLVFNSWALFASLDNDTLPKYDLLFQGIICSTGVNPFL